jgi:hypothetical protein
MSKPPEFTLLHWLLAYLIRTGGWIVALLGLAIGLLPAYRWSVSASAMVLFLGVLFLFAWRRRSQVVKESVIVEAHANWTERNIQRRYSVESLLKRAGTDHARIGIAARTCFRWFCGSESDYARDPAQFRIGKGRLHKAIEDAFSKNEEFMLSVVLQCPKAAMQWWHPDSPEVKLNEEHFRVAVQSIGEIKNRLQHDGDRFILFVTNSPIPNSMTRITRPRPSPPLGDGDGSGGHGTGSEDGPGHGARRVTLLIVDLSDPFFLAPSIAARARLRKPFVVFETDKGHIDEYLTATETLCGSPASCSQCSENECPAKGIALASTAVLRSAMGL